MTTAPRIGNQRLEVCVTEAFNKPRQPRTPPFSDIEEQAIYGAYQRGMSMQAIANLQHVSRWKISATIHRQHRKTQRRQEHANSNQPV